jgi:uncharacterized membrane protein HdeD (DUF308 family)
MEESQLESTIKHIPRSLAIRGVIAIAFGVVVLLNPSVSLATLVFLVAAFATVDGVASLVFAFISGGLPTSARLWLVLNGIAGIGVGVITVLQPGISELALLYVIGAWAIFLGAMELYAAISMQVETRFKVLLGVYGLISIAFGVILFVRPGTGALGVLSLISAYAIITGITLIAAAWDLRSAGEDVKNVVRNTISQARAAASSATSTTSGSSQGAAGA